MENVELARSVKTVDVYDLPTELMIGTENQICWMLSMLSMLSKPGPKVTEANCESRHICTVWKMYRKKIAARVHRGSFEKAK